MNPARRRQIELGILLSIVILGWYWSYEFTETIPGYRYGAAAWPRVILLLLALFAIVQFFLGGKESEGRGGRDGTKQSSANNAVGGLPWLMVVLPFLYAFLLPRTGFIVTTPFFVSALVWTMGERRYLRILLVTLVIISLVFVVFVRLLYIPLPVGNWPHFYDINNWLLVRMR